MYFQETVQFRKTLFLNGLINCLFFQGVEDIWRNRHPGGLCNQHVLCGGLCDVAEQRAALRSLCPAVRSLSVLCRLPGKFVYCKIVHLLLKHCLTCVK